MAVGQAVASAIAGAGTVPGVQMLDATLRQTLGALRALTNRVDKLEKKEMYREWQSHSRM